MSKRFTIGLLVFFAGVAGNLVAGWLQQGKWAIQPTTEQFLGTLLGASLILFVVALLESERALAWNWRWHRFWYLRELLKNPYLRHWETDFARLEMVQGKRKIFGAEVIAEGKRQDMVEVLRELIIDSQEKTSRVLVLGEPGSGKTTGLERLTLDLARAGLRRLGIGCKMPMLLRLGSFQQGTLLDFAAQKMEQATKRSSGEILSKGINKLIRQGRVVLLCDALDEALGSRRDLVLAELKSFLEDQAYQDVPIVITSRTREDPGSGLKGLTIFEIQNLNDDAVNAFIRAYKRPAHSETEITQRLQNHRLLESSGLGRNPFWLRLIVASGAFEGNKGQILNTAVDTLLAREWDEKPAVERSWRRVLPRDEQLEETKWALAFLGYWMSAGNLVAIEQDGVLMALEKGWLAKREQVGVKGLRPQDILGLGRDAQVLVYNAGPIRFRHRLLQEFMTAWMLMIDDKLCEKEIKRCVQDMGWWETLFLLGGLLGANSSSQAYRQFVQRVLDDGTNDQCLFVAIGLLRSVENPPADISRTVIEIFAASVNEALTPIQVSAIQEMERILGDEAAEAFGVLFHNPDRRIKTKGAVLLCALRNKHANSILIEALRDYAKIFPTQHDISKDKTIAKILVSIGEFAVEPLITALYDQYSEVRMYAVDILGKIGDPRAVKPLTTALFDPNADVRYHAAKALRKMDVPIVEPLMNALLDPDAGVRQRAVETLSKMGAPVIPQIISDLHNLKSKVRRRAANALNKMFASIVSRHITALHNPNSDVRERAVEALGKIGTIAVPSLITALSDPNKYVRQGTADALGRTGDPRAVEPLIVALYDLDAWVRLCAVKALERIGDPQALQKLEHVAREDKGETFWGASIAGAAREAVDKIRQRVAESQKETA